MKVVNANKADHLDIVEIWERSVRATHHFLKEEDILFFKPLILNKYLDMVDLFCVRSKLGKILAFSGIHQENLEMLFVDPQELKKGLGKTLLKHAVEVSGVTKVDVNEDNHNAREFYTAMGFKVRGRSELDGTGKPYPLLHMELMPEAVEEKS